jgi:hypothetical protein
VSWDCGAAGAAGAYTSGVEGTSGGGGGAASGAGLSEEEALGRALDDFGGPEVLRSELEATHGHRLMTVVVDKALQWKEKTMKARWLWSSCALVALLLTITIECLFISGVVILLFPKYRQMVDGGWLTDSSNTNGIVNWSVNYLIAVRDFGGSALWLLIPLAIAWFIFEWRVRSDNKSFIRLSFLGMLSVALMVVAFFTGAAIGLPPLVAFASEATSEGSEQLVRDSLDNFDHSLAQLDQSAAAGNWAAFQTQLQQMKKTIPGATPAVLTIARERDLHKQLVADLIDTRKEILALGTAAGTNDPAGIKEALQRLHTAYDPLRRFANVDSLPSTQPR